MYENSWKAKNLDLLARGIKQQSNEIDLKMLRSMIESAKGKLRAMWRKEMYSLL